MKTYINLKEDLRKKEQQLSESILRTSVLKTKIKLIKKALKNYS